MTRRLLLLLALFSQVLLAACQPVAETFDLPLTSTSAAAPTLAATADPDRPPTGLTIVAVPQPTRLAPTRTPQPVSGAARVVVQGRIFDAGEGAAHRLSDATVAWQFAAADRQQDNGRLTASSSGLYRLELWLRPSDELFITTQAPGYLASTTRVQSRQLRTFSTQLDFALVKEGAPAPTVPGALGTLHLSGIVYNVARGLKAPVAQATVRVNNNSIVQPATLEMTSNLSGTFALALDLHETDQVNFTITAPGYLTTTLKRSATELARNPNLLIGLRLAPQK